ncbi:MAG: DUF5995 family protein [Terracidiphilus sp.]|jgi:hypothetical protein
MFPYDSSLVTAVAAVPQSIADVVRTLENIQAICVDGDGLKWFNGLYLQVTQAVEARCQVEGVDAGGFLDSAWIAALDVRFAGFYLNAVKSSLSGAETPGCWQALFGVRNVRTIARIQFALAGMNAHINHDLPQAVLGICQATDDAPQHGTAQYNDYTAINTTLDSLINAAKQTLHVDLLGDALPPVGRLEDTLAAWNVTAAREAAWNNAELLWNLGGVPAVAATFLDTLDGLTTVASKALLVPVL